jgi:hypothetical protein
VKQIIRQIDWIGASHEFEIKIEEHFPNFTFLSGDIPSPFSPGQTTIWRQLFQLEKDIELREVLDEVMAETESHAPISFCDQCGGQITTETCEQGVTRTCDCGSTFYGFA